MLQIFWEPDRSNPNVANGKSSNCQEAASPLSRPADMVLDTALRSVPLPVGLLTQLDRLVYAMPDEAADQVDWLGC
jgi:hypothetical protein